MTTEETLSGGEMKGVVIERELFGGAMTCLMSESYIDLSDIREVPSHQECWMEDEIISEGGKEGNVGSKLLCIEILERQDTVLDTLAAKFFFDDLAEANGAATKDDAEFVSTNLDNKEIVSFIKKNYDWNPSALLCPPSPSSNDDSIPSLCFGTGYQKVRMGRDYDTFGYSNKKTQEIHWIQIELGVIRLKNVETDLLITMSKPINSPPSASLSHTETNITTTGNDITKMFSENFLLAVSSLHIRDWTLFG